MTDAVPTLAMVEWSLREAAMGRMATDGALTRETYVWTAGQDGWKLAEDVMELAQLFTVLPPPPPNA